MNIGILESKKTSISLVIPLANIISYWEMESNGIDSVGANNGTPTNVSYTAGLVGNAMAFNGTSSSFEVPDANNLSFGNGTTDIPFSFSGILSFNNLTDQWVLNKRSKTVSTNDTEYQIIYFAGSILIVLSDQSAGGNIRITYSFTPVLGQKYKIQFTCNGNGLHTGLKLYIDGTSVGTTSLTGSYTAMENLIAPITFGKQSWAANGFFNGTLDEIVFFNIELTPTDIININAKLDSGQHLI